jgi:mannose-6-phosphate isomerase-like protein (cupin superfamily)
MKDVVNTNECMLWKAPLPHRRCMGLMFERDITPTANIAAGIVILPPGEEQTKLSVHEGEEIYYVVRGTGQFVLDERVVDVEQGTAVYIAPGVGHRAINTGDEEIELYWVNTPPVFGPVGSYRDLMKDWERIR